MVVFFSELYQGPYIKTAMWKIASWAHKNLRENLWGELLELEDSPDSWVVAVPWENHFL